MLKAERKRIVLAGGWRVFPIFFGMQEQAAVRFASLGVFYEAIEGALKIRGCPLVEIEATCRVVWKTRCFSLVGDA